MDKLVRIKAAVLKVLMDRESPTSKAHEPKRHTWAMGTNGLRGVDKGFGANSLVIPLCNLWIRKSFC